ncbi:phage tail protein [Enterococcus mediterraneensis]|uniref:phage tail protein n=1 Tax=Enterococcus mediterraneensis TaxID=2364791 RepID=UPI000F06AF9B|nr:phage tail protein [Enterococcus mediterraneensis]
MINFIDENGKQHSALVECKRKKGVNGEKSLEGTIYTNEKILEGIGRGWRLQFQGEMYCLTFVHPIDEGDRIVVEFDAVHEFFFDFSKSIIYRELNGSNTMTAYLDFIFSGSGYDYRLEVDVNAFEKQNFGMKNRLTLFKDIISSTGLEFSVNGKVVRILQEVGTDLSTIVKKGFNLNQLNIEKDAGSFITYKRGYGAYFDEGDHSKGRLTVEYLSPLAEIYGKLEGEPVIDEHYKVEDNLRTRLQKDVEESYGISAEIDMEDLTKAGYSYEQPHEGDYIMAINDDLGFRQKIRIMSYVTEFDTEENIIKHDVSCGSANLVSKVSSAENDFKDQVQADLENAVNNANSALIAANGKNKVFTGPDEPEATSIGDIWYHEIGEQTIMKYWNGYEWVPFINPDQIKDQIIEAEKGIEDAKQDANNAVNQANQAAADAGFAKDAAQNAVDQALNAISQASSASERAQEAIQNSVNAVNQAQQALNDTTELLNTVDDMQGTITSISTVVDEVNNQLAVKVDQTDFDKLAGTVSSQGTSITANANAIALKADSSTVNTIKGTVESLQSELSVQAGQITGLVSKTDGLTTDLAQLQIEAGKIGTTVAQVQNTVDGINTDGSNFLKGTSNADKSTVRNWDFDLIRPLKVGDYYTFSFNMKGSVQADVLIYLNDDTGQNRIGAESVSASTKTITTSVQHFTYTFKVTKFPDAVNQIRMRVYSLDNATVTLTGNSAMLKSGKSEASWALPPEELVTVAKFSSLEQTVNGFQATVTNQISGLTSQQTQLANQIQSTVTDLEGVNSANNLLTGFTFSNNKDVNLTTGEVTAGSRTIVDDFVPVQPNTQYTFSRPEKVKNIGFRGYASSKAYIGAVTNSAGAERITTFTTPSNCYFIKFIDESNKLTKGYRLQVSAATQSQITQLATDINLRVQKGELLSQINIQAGQTLIQTGKLYLDAATVQFSGQAFIPSASIVNLSADKINTGTLNASIVNVTNMNASNITTGTLNANRIGSKTITADKINVTSLSAIVANLGTVTAGTLNSVNINAAVINGGEIISPLFKFPSMSFHTPNSSFGDTVSKGKMTPKGFFMVSQTYHSVDGQLEYIDLLMITSTSVTVEQWAAYNNQTKKAAYGFSGTPNVSTYSGKPTNYTYAIDMTS